MPRWILVAMSVRGRRRVSEAVELPLEAELEREAA